jgi:predicted nucleotidyltransferase
MNRLIEEHRDDLIRLCAKYRVRRLEIFGSALTNRFDPRTSDLDFLVEFLPLQPGEYADAYFGLLEALRELLERNVDLVMIGAIRNRYFLESINRSRTVLYAA